MGMFSWQVAGLGMRQRQRHTSCTRFFVVPCDRDRQRAVARKSGSAKPAVFLSSSGWCFQVVIVFEPYLGFSLGMTNILRTTFWVSLNQQSSFDVQSAYR